MVGAVQEKKVITYFLLYLYTIEIKDVNYCLRESNVEYRLFNRVLLNALKVISNIIENRKYTFKHKL